SHSAGGAYTAAIDDDQSLIYQIYTSGSTGLPKGVGVKHQGVNNLLRWYTRKFLQGHASTLIISAIGFDLTQKNVLGPLCVGGRVVFPESQEYDPKAIVNSIEQHSVTVLNCAPSAFYPLVQDEGNDAALSSLQWVLLGGEPIQKHQVARWLAQATGQLVNSYGPTECTDIAAFHIVTDEDMADTLELPIGRANDGVSLKVVTASGLLAAPGVPGELWIGGEGVGAGYLQDAEKTAASFVQTPLETTGKMYRTGDLVRINAAGNLQFIGRLDNQVKLRGLRIELGEIESSIQDNVDVTDAVVIVRDEQLQAFVVGEVDTAAIQQQLKSQLPSYMVPNRWLILPELPLTPNGKVDRKALPEMTQTASIIVEPRNELEQILADYWQQLLNVNTVGVTESFFDLGGHSLLATQLVSWVRERFDVEISLRELFESPTVERLAQQVSIAQSAPATVQAPPIVAVSRDQSLPLSYAQERLWFLDQLEPDNAVYNIPAAVEIEGRFEPEHFHAAANDVVARHESLRTTFVTESGKPVMNIYTDLPVAWGYQDLSALEGSAQVDQVTQIAKIEATKPFLLSVGPLFRLVCVRLSDTRYALYLTVHHIISDGWSSSIMLQEIAVSYLNRLHDQNVQLPVLPVQYADFAYWQRNWLQGEVLEDQLTYWKLKLADMPAVLRLPTDKPRPAIQTFHGATHHFTIDAGTSRSIETICQQQGCTPFMVMLAAYTILLSRYTKQQDIAVGTPMAGRNHAEVEGIIGFFINGIVLRTQLHEQPTGEQLIQRVKDTVLGAFAHQDVPVEMIVDALQPERNLSYPPLVQVGFALQNTPTASIDYDDVTFSVIESAAVTSKYDMTLILAEHGDGYTGLVEYNTDLFLEASMATFAEHFQTVVAQLSAKPEHSIDYYTLENHQQLMALLSLETEQYEAVLPLTPMQRDLAFEHEIHPETTRNSMGLVVDLNFAIDLSLWQQAIDWVSNQHIMSRLRLVKSDKPYLDTVYQAVLNPISVPLVLEDFSAERWSESDLKQHCQSLIYQPYNLYSEPLVRHHLILLKNNRAKMIVMVNHIVADGIGGTYFAKQIVEAYEALSQKQPCVASDAVFQHYIEQAQSQFDHAQSYTYWQTVLANVEPLDYPVQAEKTAQFTVDTVMVENDEWANIKQYCRQQRTTPALFFKAIYGLMLAEYCRAEQDFVINEVVSGRSKQFLRAPGQFYQQIPVFFPIDLLPLEGDLTDYFEHVKQFTRKLGQHQHLSLSTQQRIVPQGRMHFYYNVYNFGMSFTAFGDAQATEQFTPVMMEEQVQLVLRQSDVAMAISLEYTPRQFNGAGFSQRLLMVAEQVMQGVNRRQDIQWLTAEEQNQLQPYWQPNTVLMPEYSSVVEWVQQQIKSTPDAIALVKGDLHVSYAELGLQAEVLAHWLQDNGINAQEAVAILTHRGPNFVVAQLAILLAGGCYVPLDPDYPDARLSMIMEDADVGILLTESGIERLLDFPCQKLNINEPVRADSQLPLPKMQPEHLFYQIFTSGSTGRPKGVGVTHANTLNLMQWYVREFSMTADDAVLLVSALGFDLTQKNLFAPLCAGGRIVFPTYDHYDVVDIQATIQKQQATWINCAPSALYPLLESDELAHLASLRIVLLGGEPIQLAKLSDWVQQQDVEIVNMYGPTECTDIATYYRLPAQLTQGEMIPIGQANDNVSLFVLSPQLKPVPTGCVGELYISGQGVGVGYLNDADKTAQSFIDNPVIDSTVKLYKTGDLVRQLSSGDLVFVSRVDHQVKLRGLRIELGEIEAAFSQANDIEHVVVQVIDERIIAFIQGEYDEAVLMQAAQKTLPHYMMPSVLMKVEAFALTANGKVDLKALPKPDDQQQAYVAPRTNQEQAIAEYWQMLLGIPQVGVLHNFFQIGGHSLLATQVIAWVREQYRLELPLRVLFEHPTVAGLSDQIDIKRRQGGADAMPDVVAIDRNEPIPLSFSQERLWFIDQFSQGSTAYHIPAAMKVRGDVSIEAVAEAFQQLVQRHEVLRTHFVQEGDALVQRWVDAKDIQIQQEDLTAVDPKEQDGKVFQQFFQLASQPFLLQAGPLVRFKVCLLNDNECVLMFCVHHIIADGWSLRIFIQDLVLLYQGAQLGVDMGLPELPLHYADYTVWQRSWLSGERLEAQLHYWADQLQDVPVLALPTDHKRPKHLSAKGGTFQFTLDKALADQVTVFSQNQGVTPFMTLLSCYAVFLGKYSGQDDVCIGTPVAGRATKALESMIGFFINTLPLRIRLAESPSFTGLVGAVRELTLDAFAHQDIPFEKIVEQLNVDRNSGQTPVFQTLFTLQTGQGELQAVEFEDLSVEPIEFDVPVTKFDFGMTLSESGDGYAVSIEYRTALFAEKTIERMGRHFATLVTACVATPELPIEALSMLTQDEAHYWLAQGQAAHQQNIFEPLHHLVQSAIDQAGNSIAVLDEQGQLTYAELATKSDAIAGYLLDKGVQQGDRVAVCLPRSCMMPVVMLAVLKCGAGYVPVDPDYPEQRVQYMLEDCGACLVVTAEDLSVFESLPKLTVELPTVVMTDLAYMIYTSGSTGNPKGVQLSHHSIVNHMLWMQSTFPLTVDGRVLQKTPYSFDASVWEFWSPLIQAKTLVMAKPNGHKDPAYLCEATTQHQITVLQVVPALLQVLVQQPGFASCTSLQQIFCGGELLPQSLVREVALVLPKVQLVNLYGPTEATIDSTYHVTDSSYDRDSVPIGLPITGASVYALDPQGQPVPEGVVGELMIAGDGLAIGYHQREALTAEAFYEQNTIGQRVYQTGDLVRWVKTSAHAGLSSMVLEYVARRDSQVKLRGYRIELGEIESAIQAHADVQQVTVQVIEAAMGDQRLVSYVVGSDDFAVIEQSIAQQLPDYMLPNHWQALTELPLTPSGKIDVTALPAPNVAAVEYVAAESDIEQQLVLIWQGHLGIEKVSVIGDFFAMGGHSLLAVKMVSAIEKVAGRTVPIAALFQCPSVRGMAQWLDKPQYESPLLVLNEAADLPWIFCIHPVGGQAILFR
ncbi:MAG: amino acid adenylation domain-containing protein, partial [Methylococcales bacterium]|nr:amino acid adenylation domain-containing protein [Methylococcales bacterium]